VGDVLGTLLDEVIGCLRQFGSHADSLEDYNATRQLERSISDGTMPMPPRFS
jgi:hypothetical protein